MSIRNAVFAPNQSDARQLLRAFNLPASEWSAFSFSTALMGRQFDRIVVRLPDPISERDLDRILNLRTRLAPDGVFEQIGAASAVELSRTRGNFKREDDPVG